MTSSTNSSPTRQFFADLSEHFLFLDDLLASSTSSFMTTLSGNNGESTTLFSNLVGILTSTPTYVYYTIIAFTLYCIYRYIFGNYKRPPVQHWTNESLGFNRFRRANFPPAYPNGWFKLCDVDDLENDRIQCVDALGLHLIVYKSRKTKQPIVMEAYCPHLGAHLGIGGKVTDKGVECPFHNWTIEDGEVTDIPYCDGSKPKGKVCKTFVSRVKFGMVFFWFHVENFTEEAERHAKINDGELLYPPDWEIRKINENSSENVDNWERFTTMTAKHNHHIMELSNNSPDYVHFNTMHGTLNFHPWINKITDRIFSIFHETVQYQKEERTAELGKAHLYFKNDATVNLHLPGGVKIPFSFARQTTEVNFEGPGIIHFHIETPIGSAHLIKTLIPLDHFKTYIEDAWFCDPRLPRWIAHLIAVTAKGAIHQDIPIWENKQFLKKPLLVKGDGPFGEWQRWWMGFYSETSKTWSEDHRGESLVW